MDTKEMSQELREALQQSAEKEEKETTGTSQDLQRRQPERLLEKIAESELVDKITILKELEHKTVEELFDLPAKEPTQEHPYCTVDKCSKRVHERTNIGDFCRLGFTQNPGSHEATMKTLKNGAKICKQNPWGRRGY